MYTDNEIDSISRFFGSIVASSHKRKMIHTDILKIYFGTYYKRYLGELEQLQLFDWVKTESLYGPENKHNSFIIKPNIRFKNHEITSRIGTNTVNRVLDHRNTDKALKKANKCLLTSFYNSPDFSVTNEYLQAGYHSATKDGFGNRIHSIITNKESFTRSLLRFTSKQRIETGESDIEASHPYLLTRMANEPQTFTDKLGFEFNGVIEPFKEIPIEEQEKAHNMYYQGDFYENLIELLGGSDLERLVINYCIQHADEEIPDTRRNMSKKAFMILVNSKNKEFKSLLEEKLPYTTDAIKKSLDYKVFHLFKEIPDNGTNNGGYLPYKNLALVFQRTEALCVQASYTRSTSWGHLIHDSILTTLDQTETVEANLISSYSKVFSVPPKLKQIK